MPTAWSVLQAPHGLCTPGRCGVLQRSKPQRCKTRYPDPVRGLAPAVAALAIAVTSSPTAHAAKPKTKPTRIEPEKLSGKERRAARRARDDSQGGTEDGTFEFVLGSLTAAVTAVVIGRGVWELTRIGQLQRDCDNGSSDVDCVTGNVGQGNRIAAGLSFGFAVPMSVATGFLFARAVRTRRDYRAWHQQHPSVSLMPSAGRRGGGLALQVRF